MTVTVTGDTIGGSFAEACRMVAAMLADAGVASARLDARLLVAHASRVAPDQVFTRPDRVLTADAAWRLVTLARRRRAREPLAYILGRKEFWSLPFEVSPATLIPRPDSETVVETVLARARAPGNILDLGTGSGCLLLALLHELPNSRGVGLDISPQAARIARANAQALGLGDRAFFLVGDWADALARGFDVVVANPPYITSATLADLEPEIRAYEPPAALDGGADGLACYRRLIPSALRLLRPGGLLALEVGDGQADSVAQMLPGQVSIADDFAGIARCVSTRLTEGSPSVASGAAMRLG